MPVFVLFIIVFAVSLLSGFAQTVTGFGYAIVMMAILPLFLPGGVCVAISLIGGCGISVWLLSRNMAHFKLKSIIFVTLFSSAGVLAGLLLGAKVSSALYMRILGIFLIVLSAWLWIISKKVRIPATPWTGATAGAVSGALAALFAIAGPPLVLYYNASSKSKETYMASLQATLVIQSAVAIGARASLGMWPADAWLYLIPVALGTALGVIPGKALYSKLDADTFSRVIYIFMCLSGAFIAITA